MGEIIQITGVGSELQGVGRAASGRTLFVPGALPGERVSVRVTREAERFSVCGIERVLEPSAQRAAPVCPHFERCGGCAAQHMRYECSVQMKRRRVCDALARIGGIEADARETIPSPEIWRYRNKAEYSCRFQGEQVAGVSARGSHEVLNVQDCLLQHEASVRFLRAARPLLGPWAAQLVTRVNHDGRLMAVLGASSPIRDEKALADALFRAVPELLSLHRCDLKSRPAHALDGPCRRIRGEERLSERLCGLDFALSPHSFFQVNRAQAENLVAEMLKAAGLTGAETVVDAYCGIGTLTLPIARMAKRAIGIEIVAPAVQDARRAAQANGIGNAEFICGDASVELSRLLKSGLKPDVVVVDPPRKGVDKQLIEQLIRVKPACIVYVSCDPGTLARDLKLLSCAYRAGYVQPLDMFPWTEHVESVARLCLK